MGKEQSHQEPQAQVSKYSCILSTKAKKVLEYWCLRLTFISNCKAQANVANVTSLESSKMTLASVSCQRQTRLIQFLLFRFLKLLNSFVFCVFVLKVPKQEKHLPINASFRDHGTILTQPWRAMRCSEASSMPLMQWTRSAPTGLTHYSLVTLRYQLLLA